MTESSLSDFWPIVMAVLGLITAIGGFIARDRTVSNRITDEVSAAKSESSSADDKLHQRINRLNSEMHNNFARKDEVRASLDRIERGLDNVGAAVGSIHTEIAAALLRSNNKP